MTAAAMVKGMTAGALGAGVMTAVEKLEQRFTHQPDSYVPARTLAHLLRLRDADADRRDRNLLMHYGTGIVVGAIRALMAERGLRGPAASAAHTGIRLSVDQTLENATGVGGPPRAGARPPPALAAGPQRGCA